jgi:hypothetical protein
MNTQKYSEILRLNLHDKDSSCGLANNVDEETLAPRETNLADSQEVVSIPDGMQAFLESIDACFADPSFWN